VINTAKPKRPIPANIETFRLLLTVNAAHDNVQPVYIMGSSSASCIESNMPRWLGNGSYTEIEQEEGRAHTPQRSVESNGTAADEEVAQPRENVNPWMTNFKCVLKALDPQICKSQVGESVHSLGTVVCNVVVLRTVITLRCLLLVKLWFQGTYLLTPVQGGSLLSPEAIASLAIRYVEIHRKRESCRGK